MTAVSLSKPEIVARLLEIHVARKAFDIEEGELLARLQRPKGNTARPIELTFGKNIITWDNGQALSIRGKGFRFIKTLYYASGMRLKRERLGKMVWDNEMPNHHNFKEFIRKTAMKLEKALFPYRLIPVKSKEKVQNTGKTRNGKPEKVRIQSEIIGAKLETTKYGAKVASG